LVVCCVEREMKENPTAAAADLESTPPVRPGRDRTSSGAGRPWRPHRGGLPPGAIFHGIQSKEQKSATSGKREKASRVRDSPIARAGGSTPKNDEGRGSSPDFFARDKTEVDEAGIQRTRGCRRGQVP